MGFTSLLKPMGSKPLSQMLAGQAYSGAGTVMFRDQLSIYGWLEVGACLNVLLILAVSPFIGRWAFLMPFIGLGLRLGRNLLVAGGFLRNDYMAGVVQNKASAQIPEADGTFSDKPASKPITVFLIGAKCNHPLGMFGPGFKELGDYMTAMQEQLNERAEEFGMLGASSWLEAGRATSNELLLVMYFKDAAGIHAFAHGELHREAWAWWNRLVAQHKHIAIWHEIYTAPVGHWESVYVNARPTLMGATVFPRKTEAGVQWVSPIVDARTGPLKSSKGRLTYSDGKDNDTIEGDPYANWGSLEAREQTV